MGRAVIALASTLIGIASVYLAAAFRYLSFNPVDWGADGRLGFLVAALPVAILALIFGLSSRDIGERP